MTENYPLKQAPQGYVPNCETEHTADNNMHQRFKGGRVKLDCDKNNSVAVASVDGRVIGRWTDVTIPPWGDMLCTLENDFANQIQ